KILLVLRRVGRVRETHRSRKVVDLVDAEVVNTARRARAGRGGEVVLAVGIGDGRSQQGRPVGRVQVHGHAGQPGFARVLDAVAIRIPPDAVAKVFAPAGRRA